jgi:hypothetical protein
MKLTRQQEAELQIIESKPKGEIDLAWKVSVSAMVIA